MFWKDLEVNGLGAAGNQHFYSIKYGKNRTVVPAHLCSGRGEELLRLLARRGVVIPGHGAAKILLERIDRVSAFTPADIVAAPGYTSNRFVFADGALVGAEPSGIRIAFTLDIARWSTAGTVDGWRDKVAKHLAGNPLAMMAILLGFAVPLAEITGRRMCQLIEFAGEPSVGIEFLSTLLASVAGPPDKQRVQFANIIRDRGEALAPYTSLAVPVVGVDISLGCETAQKCMGAIKTFCTISPPGEVGTHSTAKPGCLISFSAKPLLSWLDGDCPISNAVSSDQLSLQIGRRHTHGVFQRLPKRCDNTAAFIRRLSLNIAEQHGSALKAFVDHVLESLAEDPYAFKADIKRHIEAFQRFSKADMNDLRMARIVETMGLVYAAGCIAKRAAILPSTWRIDYAVGRVYRRHFVAGHAETPFSEEIRRIAADPATLQCGNSEETDDAIRSAKAFVSRRTRGNELWIRPRFINELIPDWEVTRRSRGAQRLLIMESGHRTVKWQLAKGVTERVICFRLHPRVSMPT
jgi:hypothetical protein